MSSLCRAFSFVMALGTASAVAPLAQVGGAAQQAAPAAQNPNLAPSEAGTGAISGVILDGATKTPLAGAVVYLGPPSHGPPGAPVRQLTDAKGRFVFRDLPAFGNYFLQATKFGYFTGHYGRASSGALGGRIALLDGQWFAEGDITMWRPAAVSGRVVDQAGEPVVGVYVRVLARILISGKAQLAAGPVTVTDDRGAYRIGGLSPGQYIVQVPSVQSSLPVSAVMPADAAAANADAGRPLTARDGMMDVDGANRLLIGRYTTPLLPVDGKTSAYPPTFYPGVTAVAEATALDLKHSEDRLGVDFQVRPVASFRVSGIVLGPDDALANLTLRLMPQGAEELGDGSEVATTLVGKGGAFTFLNVPAGAYTLEARRTVTQFEFRGEIGQTLPLPRPPSTGSSGGSSSSGVFSGPPGTTMSTRSSGGTDAYWARMAVTVEGRDVRDVAVALRRAVTMTGRFVWAEGEQPAPNAPAAPSLVRLLPAGGNASLGLPRSPTRGPGQAEAATDRFTVEGLLPGEYVLSLLGSGRVKSVTWKGRDYTHRPFDATSGEDFADVLVTLTSKSIILTGRVLDNRGVPDDEAAVIVFPVEREQWVNYGFSPDRIKAIQVTNAGAYRFQSLPAGDYYAIAVNLDLINAWLDPAFLDRASRLATRFSVEWGDTKAQDLKLMVIK